MAMTTESEQKHRWSNICGFLDRWYHKPDTEALAVALSVYASHCGLEHDPVWLFIIGPSGSGKTQIVCNAILGLPDVIEASDVTPSAFLSGKSVHTGGANLLFSLPTIGKNTNETQGVIVFKDFSSLLASKLETRNET